MKMSGNFDDLFKGIVESVNEAVEGTHTFEEVFSDEFVQSNSKFSNINDLLKNSPMEVDKPEEIENIEDIPEEFDKFIKQNTECENWEDFRQAAGTELARKKLNESGLI